MKFIYKIQTKLTFHPTKLQIRLKLSICYKNSLFERKLNVTKILNHQVTVQNIVIYKKYKNTQSFEDKTNNEQLRGDGELSVGSGEPYHQSHPTIGQEHLQSAATVCRCEVLCKKKS